MGRVVAIVFFLVVLTANFIEGASLAGLIGSEDENISDVTSLIDGGYGGEELTDLPVKISCETGGNGDLDITVGSILGGVTGEDVDLESIVGSVLGGVTGEDGSLDSTVGSVLGGETGEDGSLDSAVGSVLTDSFVEDTVGDILGRLTGDGDLDSTVESILSGLMIEMIDDRDEDRDLDSTVDFVLGGDVLTDLTGGNILGEVTGKVEDIGSTGDSVLGVTDEVGDFVSTVDMVLEGVQDRSNDGLLIGVTDSVGDVVGAVEPVLESVIGGSGNGLPVNDVFSVVESVGETVVSSGGGGDTTEAINPSGGIVQGTTSTVSDGAGNVPVDTTSVLSNPRTVKVLVPVLRKLMTNKSTLGTLFKLAVVGRLKKAEQNY